MCLSYNELDILCVAETKLLGQADLKVDNYTWFGHNRSQLHVNARTGSGGVGILVKNELLYTFDAAIIDNTHEGILWIQFKEKVSGEKFNICVCYLPPEGSTRNIDADEYFETLLSQVYCYQQNGPFFICGDFNSRISDTPDYIEGVDIVPVRDVIDFKRNAYGTKMIDFLLSSNCCVLNGRPGVCIQNDFTSISTKGLAVVDYCAVPHESLHRFSEFRVQKSSELFNSAGCVSVIDPSQCMPDHSMLTWCFQVCHEVQTNANNISPVTITRLSRDFPVDFLQSNIIRDDINSLIEQMQTQGNIQQNIDNIYDSFCDVVKEEMVSKSLKKTVTVNSGLSNKRRKMGKPWWNDELTLLWQNRCAAEKAWSKAPPKNRVRLKPEMRAAQKLFDKEVQKAKRHFWKKGQEELLCLNSKDPREFWKRFGEIGIGAARKPSIPWEVVLNDGIVSNNKDDVLNRWKSDFCNVLNSAPVYGSAAADEDENSPQHGEVTDTGINNPLTLAEVKKAITRAKRGKAVGYDDLPVEALDNTNAIAFMHNLFRECYAQSIVPSVWLKGIINPIPKNHTQDPRDPLNFRGITLACSMYKLYCSVLNARLTKWAETNELIADEQNGFRAERSCLDQLSSLTNIIETRKSLRKSTYALFVDFEKAFDRVNRHLLWSKLENMGLGGKMLCALKSIYNNVQCCVRINSVCTDFFNVSSGVKQGCLLSPVLFNLFVNDLIYDMRNSGSGVAIDNVKVAVLGYADDLVCLSDTAEGLQNMLDILYAWCRRFSMNVNVLKTQIVHFRPISIPQTDFKFEYNGCGLSLVKQYKYLGLILTEFLDYGITAYNVAQSAGRALGLLIAKSKANGGMPYKCFTKLYESLVQPVIDYGSAIWGTKNFSCINAVQHRACRFFMGVGKYTPNCAVQGDMGWPLPAYNQWLCVSKLWCRSMCMNDNRLNKKIFLWSLNNAGRNKKNWSYRVCKFYCDIQMQHLNNPLYDFSNSLCDIKEVLREMCETQWFNNMIQSAKLRTYKLFKDDCKPSYYLKVIHNKNYRSALAKFRCGVAPIRLETGRYEQLQIDERICPTCNEEIEDEEHVLIRCNTYNDVRQEVFRFANSIDVNFDNMDDRDKLCFVLSNEKMCSVSAKACYSILCARRCILYGF